MTDSQVSCLLDIIEDPDATHEEKRAARRLIKYGYAMALECADVIVQYIQKRQRVNRYGQ